MQGFDIHRGLRRLAADREDPHRAGEELVFPRDDLSGVAIEPLRQLGERASLRTAARATLALKAEA